MVKVIREKTSFGKQLKISLDHLDGKVGKVGWFEKSRYPDENNKKGLFVATVATIQEYGLPSHNIPPRPFMRTTIREKKQEWLKLAGTLSKFILHGKLNIENSMETIGQKAVGDIRSKIRSILTPPLSPRTIQARLNRKSNKKKVGLLTKPLIDTAHMIQTLINTVEDE